MYRELAQRPFSFYGLLARARLKQAGHAEPIALPLKKIEGKSQELPIEMSGEKQDDDTGLLTLAILGQYQATLQVKRAE